MNRVTEYLKELNITSYELIGEYIASNSIKTINSLVLHLRKLIDDEYAVAEYTPFTFLPNADISGAGGCDDIPCKIKRAIDFSIFTALYADKVYIKLNFITSEHYERCDIDKIESDNRETARYKRKMSRDLCIIIAYFELIERGIVRITPARYMKCPQCFQQDFFGSESIADISELKADYSRKAKVILQKFNEREGAHVRIENLDEFFPDHPLTSRIYSPEILQLLSKEKVGSEIKNKLFKNDYISGFIESEIIEASYTAIYCQEQSARLITNKTSDAMFFGMSKNHNNLKRLEESHKSLPEYLMPIVKNLNLRDLIRLREEEHESFNKYRIALNMAISEQQKATHEIDSLKIYDDIIFPEFNNLNMKLKQLKQGSLKRIFGTMSIAGSVLVANMFGSIINPALLAVTIPLGTAVCKQSSQMHRNSPQKCTDIK